MRRFIVTKNPVVEPQNLVMNHASRPVKSNPEPEYESKAADLFDNTNIKITTSGQRYLEVPLLEVNCIENNTSKKELANGDELLLLSNIVEIQPQTIYYSAYIHGFEIKYNFFNSTIPTVPNHMKIIIEDALRNHFIPVIIIESLISEHLRQLIVLPMRLGGMATTTLHLNTEVEYNASRLLTTDAVDHHHQPRHRI